MPKLIRGQKQILLRIVYVGPGVGGKTTNLKYMEKVFPELRLVELATVGDRTFGGDFMPLVLGAEPIDGYEAQVSLASVPGQLIHRPARADVLRNADVVVFVADLHPLRVDANRYALEDLRALLVEQRRDPAKVPIVFQGNKSDLPDAVGLEDIDALLNPGGAPMCASIAVDGVGVFETLRVAIGLAFAVGREYIAEVTPPQAALA